MDDLEKNQKTLIEGLAHCVTQHLLPALRIESVKSYNPVKVLSFPQPWFVLGAGNYAAVFCHPDYPRYAVKVYAPGRPGLVEEADVYQRLGSHPAYAECLLVGEHFLILTRLAGTTLYDCLHEGLYISEQVIEDIDQALDFARRRGLYPHDVHGRNVMMANGRGLVVDVSDFAHQEYCPAWDDLKKAYRLFYRPIFFKFRVRIPYFFLDLVRLLYRFYRCGIRRKYS